MNHSAFVSDQAQHRGPSRQHLIQSMLDDWQHGQLQPCFEKAVEITRLFPKEGIAWKLLGVLQLQQGQMQHAVDAFKQAASYLKKDAEIYLNWGHASVQLGDLPQACTLYEQAIALQPKFASAHASYAGALKDLGETAKAKKSFQKALTLDPDSGYALFELAGLLQQEGKTLEAIQYYRRAVKVEPQNPALAYNMALALDAAGNKEESIQQLQRAVQLNSNYVDAWCQLGQSYRLKGLLEQAEQAYLRAVSIDPEHWDTLNQLAQLYRLSERAADFQACMQRIMQLKNPSVEQLNNVAAQLIDQAMFGDAEKYCQQALALGGDNGYVFCNLGLIAHARMHYEVAGEWFEKALQLLPDSTQILNNYSVTLRVQGLLSKSLACLHQARANDPGFISTFINLSNVYLDQGHVEAAIQELQKLLEIDPNNVLALKNMLYCDSYANMLTAEQHKAYARQYGALVTAPVQVFEAWLVHAQDKRLRIGLVSADLRTHPVGYFLDNWLQHFDASQIEIYGYSTDGREDTLTHRLKNRCNHWRSLAGLSDESAARAIHADGIHILLDLSGYTAGGRLPIFAWQPAPVQASWLGYWSTIGLPAIEYVITDPISAGGLVSQQFCEKIAHLPQTRMCFAAPDFDVAVSDLPALQNTIVTFGCTQNYTKVSDQVLALWARVMQAVPGSQLRWQCKAFSDEEMHAQALLRLEAAGITSARCQLLGKTSREDYLQGYHQIDMMLDSFPFTGGTTTCEALWMGVPTLTLLGDTLIARQGASMMTCAGLADWVAETEAQYVEKAIQFANDLPALANVRQQLRAQVVSSPLMDGALFAEEMQTLLQQLWQQKTVMLQLQQFQATQPIQHAFEGSCPVWIVSATRKDEETFWNVSALGVSLKRHMQQDTRISAHVAYENQRGLSEIFNEAIVAAPADAILVMVHDDVWLDQNPLVQSIEQGLQQFDVIGVAGNRRLTSRQPAWAFVNTDFTWDAQENLCGQVSHGEHAFGVPSVYGDLTAACVLMDGVLLIAQAQSLKQHHVRFDPQFDFHFYDLDFCRTATQAGLKLGVWPIAITHQSGGAFGSVHWREKYQAYLQKWEPAQPAIEEDTRREQLIATAEEVFKHAAQAHQSGDLSQASQLYEEILRVMPTHALTHNNLALIALQSQQMERGLKLLETAIQLAPNEIQFWANYLRALVSNRKTETAHSVFAEARKAGFSDEAVRYLLDKSGLDSLIQASSMPSEQIEKTLVNLFMEKEYAVLEERLLGLLNEFPTWLNGWKMLSDTYLTQGKDARLPAMQALALNMEDPQEHCYYGLVLKAKGDLKGAAKAFRKAIELRPDYSAAHNNLGIVLKDTGEVEEGIQHFKQALKSNPNYHSCFSNLLFCMSHTQLVDLPTLLAEHYRFSACYERPLQPFLPMLENSKEKNRIIHVGFVSSDFRDHSVSYFLEPILKHLSRQIGLTLHAYSSASTEDSTTERLRGKFRYWNQVGALSDEGLADKVRADGIDILVDLSGHTSGNRLMTFARKPAPIQVSWLGYLNTTGLTAMDYYLADQYLLPVGKLDHQFTEKPVQLPANAAFMPSDVAPEVNDLPALKKGYVTFACFNRPNKITKAVVHLWAKLLLEVPNAKMLLGGLPNDGSYDAIIAWFGQAGIDRNRLEFHPRSFMKNYLKLHHEVDICLDTFPSNGVTTTCHAVWMGVPTLCLDGDRLTSRGAMAVMQHVGLSEFVAQDENDFIQKGISWAHALPQLSEVRASLRERFNQSALAQPEMLADSLEKAFRQMWHSWCDGQAPQSFSIETPQVIAKKNEIIYVTQPLLPKLEDYVPYLEKIWENKFLTNGGPFHQQLEKALCEYLGVNHISIFSNGTLALLTALQALRISGEVITTPYSFVATSHSLLWNGIKPVFVDIDPDSLNMDPAKIEAAITADTTAIMPVHCYGHPCDVERIQRIADDYNLKVIYDAAHAFGVQHKGQSLLKFGDLSVLSFHATKVFNTFEGGAIVCPDAKTKQHIDHLKNFGFVDEVTVVAAGINGKMSEINAAFGLLQLKGIDDALLQRQTLDAYYRDLLAGITGIDCVPTAGEDVANYAYFPVMVRAAYPISRDALYQKLKDAGIYVRRYFYPLISDFPMYRNIPSALPDNLPVAQQAASQVICLPMYPELKKSDIRRIVDLIKEAVTPQK